MGRLTGKVAVVTGGAQGIGRRCAEMMAAEGAKVVIGDIADDLGERAAADIRSSGGKAVYQHCNVEVESDCAALLQTAVDRHGGLNVLLNNAGWFPRCELADVTPEFWNKVLNINLRGPFFFCKHAIPIMQRGGGGSVINVGSPNSLQAIPTLIPYGAAKGALINLTRTMAAAYAKDRIRFNLLSPGWVLTDTEKETQRKEGRTPEQIEEIGRGLRLGRFQTPDDSGHAVVFLASDESSQVTGMIFSVDAGSTTLIR